MELLDMMINVSIAAFAAPTALWLWGRTGPMNWHTDKVDMAALVVAGIGMGACALYAAAGAEPQEWAVALLCMGMGWWLLGPDARAWLRKHQRSRSRRRSLDGGPATIQGPRP